MKEEIKLEAIEICKKILSELHKNNFEEVISLVDESEIDDLESFLKDFLQGSLDINGFNSVDEYGAECSFKPDYEYSQLVIDEYDDNSGFYLDYELTSGGELVDLVLQLEFLYEDDGIRSIFKSIEPQ